jgi:hypothetical protein
MGYDEDRCGRRSNTAVPTTTRAIATPA